MVDEECCIIVARLLYTAQGDVVLATNGMSLRQGCDSMRQSLGPVCFQLGVSLHKAMYWS
jgi:hypothetical protein